MGDQQFPAQLYHLKCSTRLAILKLSQQAEVNKWKMSSTIYVLVSKSFNSLLHYKYLVLQQID